MKENSLKDAKPNKEIKPFKRPKIQTKDSKSFQRHKILLKPRNLSKGTKNAFKLHKKSFKETSNGTKPLKKTCKRNKTLQKKLNISKDTKPLKRFKIIPKKQNKTLQKRPTPSKDKILQKTQRQKNCSKRQKPFKRNKSH